MVRDVKDFGEREKLEKRLKDQNVSTKAIIARKAKYQRDTTSVQATVDQSQPQVLPTMAGCNHVVAIV